MSQPTATIERTHSGPVHAFDDAESNFRTYVHPRTGERFTSVTTALGILTKDALPYWYGKMSAIRAIELTKELAAAGTRRFCEGTHCGRCMSCLLADIQHAGERERDAAADRGTRFHHVAEVYAVTGEIIPHAPDIAPHIRNFLTFVEIHKVTFHASEVTVLNRADGWGGTLDTVLSCGWMPKKHVDLIGVPLYGDYKTSNGIYEQSGLQLAGYRNAESVLLPDGSEDTMPDAHTDIALSIQIKATGWWVRPCPTTPPAYEKFVRALQLWRDINEPDLDLVGRAMYKPRAPKTAKEN